MSATPLAKEDIDGNRSPQSPVDSSDMESHSDPAEDSEPVEVPPGLLSRQALLGVAEAFVLREGTDYGARELTHAEKVSQVLAALDRGEAQIFFDPESDSVTLRLRDGRAT